MCRYEQGIQRAGEYRRGMKPISIAGIVLIVLGLVALAYQGFTYTTRDTVIDLGPIHATAEHEKTVPLPPILGIAAVAAGVVLMVTGARKRT
jgi:membrane-bound ClpP family serine protease